MTEVSAGSMSRANFQLPTVSEEDMEMLRDRLKPSVFERVLPVLSLFSPFLILVVWELLSRTGALDARFFPPPSSIVDTFWQQLTTGSLPSDARATVQRVIIGFVMGSVPALALGLMLGIWRVPRLIITPILSALYPVPKIVIYPLLLLIFGLGETPKYVIIAIVVFFLVFFNTLTAVVHIPQIYVDVARNAGASRLRIFTTVAMPASVPGTLTGMRLAAGTAFVVIAATEFVGATNGLGYFIWASWQTYAVSQMYVGVVVISAIGYLSIVLFDFIERCVAPWARN